MVRELIARQFTVKLSVVSVGRWLTALGLSPQRPLYRAYQADPEAVAAWKRERYPAIVAEAKKAGATVYLPTKPVCAATTTPAPPGPRSGEPRW